MGKGKTAELLHTSSVMTQCHSALADLHINYDTQPALTDSSPLCANQNPID